MSQIDAVATPEGEAPEALLESAGESLLTKGVARPEGIPQKEEAPAADIENVADETEESAEEAAPEAEADPLAEVPESAEGYDLAFTNGVAVDAVLLGAFRSTAHELGLNQGQAQKLAELYAGHIAGAEKKQAAAMREAVDGWEKEISESPGFSAQKTDAQRALAIYGSPELFSVLDETLIGSHPAMFRFMAKIGRALAEPDFKGKSGSAQSDMAKVFYPNQN